MNSTVAYKTPVCAQYETLLTECEAALEAWDERCDIRHGPHGIFGPGMVSKPEKTPNFGPIQ